MLCEGCAFGTASASSGECEVEARLSYMQHYHRVCIVIIVVIIIHAITVLSSYMHSEHHHQICIIEHHHQICIIAIKMLNQSQHCVGIIISIIIIINA